MVQVLLIEQDEPLRQLLKLNAMKMFGVDIIEKSTSVDAISFIQLLPNLDLIICRDTLVEIGEVMKYLIEDNSSIPVLWAGNPINSYKNLKTIPSETSWDKLLQEAGKILGISQPVSNGNADYEAVPVNYFFNITSMSLGCDVYLKKKKDGADHYLKCLHSTDNFTRADIEKYVQSGLKEFYVPKSHFVQFVNFVSNKLVMQLDSKMLNGEKRMKLTGEAYMVSVERIQSIGIDNFTIEIVETNIKSMMTSVNEANALGNFLKMMKENPVSYVYSNAYLTSLILYKIVGQFDWSSAQVKEKLTYVAYLHNISLKDENMMKVRNEQELDALNLNSTEKTMVLQHAMRAASMVEGFSVVPDGVGMIIKEHHGAKNGVGFPESLSISIMPLSMMFIVVEDFVDEFLKLGDKPTRTEFDKIFEKLDARYNKITYAQTLKALKDMIFNKK